MQVVRGREVSAQFGNHTEAFVNGASSGAVQCGLDGNQVESRIARRHYGVVYDAKFDPAIHFNERKIWCPLQERYFVRDRARWYINKVLTVAHPQ